MSQISIAAAGTGATDWRASSAGRAPNSAESDTESAEFGGAMAAADIVALQSGVKPQPVQTGGAVEMKATAGGQAEVQAALTSKLDKAVPRQAGGDVDKAALIQKMAVSSNTGAEIAGLKPWSPDWVFEGAMNRHPMQKTLMGDSERGVSADVLAKLEKMIQQAGARSAENPGELQLQGMPGSEDIQEIQLDAPGMKGERGGQKSLGGDDFLSVRQNVQNPALTANAKVAVERSLQSPLSGGVIASSLQSSDALPGVSGNTSGSGKGKNGKSGAGALDTLGLIHPQMGRAEAGGNVVPFKMGANALQVDGQVVAGAMSRNRLSSEAVGGVSQTIRQLGANGGGEMRIRLNPENLGELRVKVSTSGRAGSEVGLQIQATDERAKRILEESMGSLKESLASQNLSLAKVDVQVAAPSSERSSMQSQMQSDQGQQGQFSANHGNGGRSDEGYQQRSGGDSADGPSLRTASRARANWNSANSSTTSASGSGRLDVMA